jgi:hypothetical protein
MVWPTSQSKSISNWKVTSVTTTTMLSSQPPKKPLPPNPNRLGPPKLKGKGKAKAAMPEKEIQADQPEASGNYNTLQDEGPPMHKSKKAWKRWLANEAEEVMAWVTPADRKEVWGTAQQVEPSQEEVHVNCFLSYRNDTRMDLDAEVATLSVEMSKASRPTSLWSASSEQYLQPSQEEGHSSSASSKASKPFAFWALPRILHF